jgi:uncharacterized protein YndB with AHSA1/START domain
MTTTTSTRTTQVFRVYIKASPEKVWEAITSREWTAKYGYPGHSEYDLRPGGAFRALMPAEMAQGAGVPEVVVDGEVVECDPPRRLVQTWRFNFMPEHTAEGFHEVIWDLHEEHGGITRLTVTHDVTDAPMTAAMIEGSADLGEGGGGWAWILSDLKTLLETGNAIEG